MRPDIRFHPQAIVAGIRGRLRALFSRDAMERELDDEMRFHLDMEIANNVKAGMSPSEARRVALVAFGGVDRAVEAHRDARGGRFIEDALADIRYAARALGRTPGFVAISVLTLAVSMALGTLGFTGMNAFIYRPLPVPDGQELLSVFTSDFSGRGRFGGGNSYADIADFARESAGVAEITGEGRVMMTIAVNEEPAYVQGAVVSSGYFRVARVRPAMGNFPAAADIPAIVISHSLWRRTFGADTAIIGKAIRVNGRSLALAAVAPPEFRGFNRENGVDFWIDGTFIPLVLLHDDMVARRGFRSFRGFARLREGRSIEALRSRLSLAADRLFEADPRSWRDTTGEARIVTVMREQDAHLAGISRAERVSLVAAVVAFGLGLVVIACTNLASMQMARGASRRRETATRLALGAGRGRVVRQLLAECAVVAVPGLVLGVALALSISGLMSYYRPIPLPSLDLSMDWRALAFITGAVLLTLLVFGLLPALQSVRADVLTDLKGGDAGPKGIRIGGVRRGLIVAQVAMSMTFTAFAGLVALSLVRHANEGRGEAGKLLVTRVNFLPAAGDSDRVEVALNELLDGIRGIPGVRGVSVAARIPLRGTRATVEGEVRSANGVRRQRELDVNSIRSGYLDLVGLPILRGRDFKPHEPRNAGVAIVSKQMADALWPGEDPIGKAIMIGRRNKVPHEVIGVVADPAGFVPATEQSYPGLLYLPLQTWSEAEMMLHVRAPEGQEAIAEQIGKLGRRFSSQLVIPKPITLDDYYDNMLLPMRAMAQGSAALAALQFLMAIAGLSGLVAYVTELRRREIGIRTALGATRSSVLVLVTRQGVRLTGIGAAIGLAAGGMIGRGVGGSLPVTPATLSLGLLASAIAFTVVGTAAMLVPARRALAVTPAAALRVD